MTGMGRPKHLQGIGNKWFWLVFAIAVIALWVSGDFRAKPTEDQLYGCTVAQADPQTGECR